MPNTVLVLPAGQTATVIIKSLRRDSSLRIISADTNFLAPGLHLADKGYLIPQVSDPAFYDKVQDIISRESVDLIFPSGMYNILLVNLQERLSKTGVKVLASEPATIDICLDKWKTYQYLSETLSMPRSTIDSDAERISNFIGFPAIIKPRDGSGSKNVYKLEDLGDMRYYMKKVPSPMVQEFISGKVYSADVLVGADGESLCTVFYSRLGTSDGHTIRSVIETRKELVELVRQICKSIKFFGNINIDVIIDEKDSKPKLIDLNPRIGNGVILSVAAGFNLPLNAVYSALEKPLESMHLVPYPLYMSRYYEEIFLEDSTFKDVDTTLLQ